MDNYSKYQVSKMLEFQKSEIMSTIDSIVNLLKFVPRKVDIQKEIPIYNFKGQTIDDAFDIDFLENTYGFKYVHINEQSSIYGFEKEIITRIIRAYVVSSDDKVFLLEITGVYANPILINKTMGIRAGHYFLVEFVIEISYSLNKNLFKRYESAASNNDMSKQISKYYSEQNIKLKLMPICQRFITNDYNLIQELKEEGILNSKLFFKRSAKNNPNYLIEINKTNDKVNYNGYEIISTRGKKQALAGIYSGKYLDVLIITKTLYYIDGEVKLYLGETKQIYYNNNLNEKMYFNSIIYNILNFYSGIPSEIEYK